MVGDFNFCSTNATENGNIPKDFKDVWPEVRGEDPGWTEDTAINRMHFNQKREHKQVRIDRVLISQEGVSNELQWIPESIQLEGTEPIDDLPEIWPSDHFGLLVSFKLN